MASLGRGHHTRIPGLGSIEQKLQFVLEALDINQQYTLAGMLENFAGKKVVRSRMNSLQGNP